MVNYSKWDAIGDSSDDEAPSRLAQDVDEAAVRAASCGHRLLEDRQLLPKQPHQP